MGQEQRDGSPVAGPNMQEVDPLAIDGREKLLVAVQAGLVDPPVVGVEPVADDLPEIVQGHALPPADAGDLIRTPRPSQAFGQVGQHARRYIDHERLQSCHSRDVTTLGQLLYDWSCRLLTACGRTPALAE